MSANVEHRFVVTLRGKPRNFLNLLETPKGDLVLSQRGRFHSGPFGEFSHANRSDQVTSITVHPNLQSPHGSITINYKRLSGAIESRKIAHALGVKHADRLFPVYCSIGRNLAARSCDVSNAKIQRARLIHLWPSGSIDTDNDSLAFMLLVANPRAQFLIPDEFPRNTVTLNFSHLQVMVFYWLFNQPTRPYWSNFIPMIGDKFFGVGLELHEALNYTNDLTLLHASGYESIPLQPVTHAG